MKNIFTDDRGSYQVLMALLLPILLVFAAGGVDLLRVYGSRQNLQHVVDSAVYAAMKDIARKTPEDTVNDYIKGYFRERKDEKLISLKATRLGGGERLQVDLVSQVRTPFWSAVGKSYMNHRVVSIARSECKPYDATYLGHAFINSDNEYVITRDRYNQRGWVWVNNRFDMNQRQDISIRLYFGVRDRGGADGMAFSIHNDPSGHRAQGQIGESLGVAWHPSYAKNEGTIVAPAVVVEFDTWRNGFDMHQDHTAMFKLSTNRWDRYGYHTSYVDHRRRNQIMRATMLPNIENGQFYYARFIWDPSDRSLTYFFNSQKIGSVSMNLTSFLGSNNAILGFSASTGGARNEHRACFTRTVLE